MGGCCVSHSYAQFRLTDSLYLPGSACDAVLKTDCAGREAEDGDGVWPLGHLGNGNQDSQKTAQRQSLSQNFLIFFSILSPKRLEVFMGLKPIFVEFGAAAVTKVLNDVDVESPGAGGASPWAVVPVTSPSVWRAIDVSGLVFLFVCPEQYKHRTFLFLPCGMN